MIPCELCGKPTDMTGTRRCNRCWELETRVQRDPELCGQILGNLYGKTEFKSGVPVLAVTFIAETPENKNFMLPVRITPDIDKRDVERILRHNFETILKRILQP